MRRLLQQEGVSVILAWIAVIVVLGLTFWATIAGAIGWILLGVGLGVILLVPPIAHRNPSTMVPWPLATIAALPFIVGVITPPGSLGDATAYITVAAIGLLVVIELDSFTPVTMNRGFAIAFVVFTTMTVAGVWELSRWTLDLVYGTTLVEDNDALMHRLIAATGVGLVAGIVVDRYLARIREERIPAGIGPEDAEEQVDAAGEAVSRVLATVGISEEREEQIVRAFQGVLLVILTIGLATLNIDVVFSATVGLLATLLPGIFERNYQFRVDGALTIWIAVAVVFHALGTVWFYQTVWGWHNIAHATTGSLVAGVGYTLLRTLEVHTTAVSFPPKFTLFFVVIFVFAVGVVWEIFEFTLDQVAVAITGEEMLLTQHGLQDTMTDLVANTVGAIVVAVAATVYRI